MPRCVRSWPPFWLESWSRAGARVKSFRVVGTVSLSPRDPFRSRRTPGTCLRWNRALRGSPRRHDPSRRLPADICRRDCSLAGVGVRRSSSRAPRTRGWRRPPAAPRSPSRNVRIAGRLSLNISIEIAPWATYAIYEQRDAPAAVTGHKCFPAAAKRTPNSLKCPRRQATENADRWGSLITRVAT
ncbi:hypothetical protein GA0061098_103080 [Bradyrhizobium shewense]|uniref:Uncharacterized protein n=1 Tax=Bradyrhizobium shewense TaxID=1761772 RepID=A0A1C3XRB2_9BRAD|nr:hypothetical protein GA0061098_103080 [Bradyrhizobium shewense]